MLELIQDNLELENVPTDGSLSTIILIYKKGSRTLCENDRGISLIMIVSKLLARIIFGA